MSINSSDPNISIKFKKETKSTSSGTKLLIKRHGLLVSSTSKAHTRIRRSFFCSLNLSLFLCLWRKLTHTHTHTYTEAVLHMSKERGSVCCNSHRKFQYVRFSWITKDNLWFRHYCRSHEIRINLTFLIMADTSIPSKYWGCSFNPKTNKAHRLRIWAHWLLNGYLSVSESKFR